ncbi:hypothetical protein HZC30_07260 [Candidatus Woesearchaeota archaeon]|nr:hypothetical protein [Candidatus Woesearchaeota archaeon]
MAKKGKLPFQPLTPTKAEKQMPGCCAECKVDSYALAYALAVLFAAWTLVVGLLGKMGFGLGMVEMIQKVHPLYSLSFGGIIGGMAVSALCGLITGFAAGWLYDWFS